MNARLHTGHEADVAATEAGGAGGEMTVVRVRVGGWRAPGTLAHPLSPLGRQPDGGVVLAVEAWRRFGQPRDEVVANVLATVFLPRAATGFEAGFDGPAWRVDEFDKRQPLKRFGPGQICDYWDGRRPSDPRHDCGSPDGTTL